MSSRGTLASRLLLLTIFAVWPWPASFAETARVTGWNLNGIADQAALKQVAANLSSLDPDVVLIQGVRDWQMCAQMTEALKPANYHVLACSAFTLPGESKTNREAKVFPGQVAVLAKEKAYASWSDPWQGFEGAGGYVFAAVQVKGQRLGFVCAVLNDSVSPTSVLQQLRQQADAISRWELNRVQSLVIGLSSTRQAGGQDSTLAGLVPLLQDAGFTDTLDALAADQRTTVTTRAGQLGLTSDFVLAQPTVFPSPLRPRAAVMGRYPVTCDLEMDASKVAAAWTARAQELQLRSSRAQEVATAVAPGIVAKTARAEDSKAWWWAAIGAMGTACVFLTWFIWISRSKKSAPPLLVNDIQVRAALPEIPVSPDVARTSSYTVVVSSPGATPPPLASETSALGWEQRARNAEQEAAQAKSMLRKSMAASLTRWLKQKFVRQLVSDRADLLQAQQSAALQAMQVDERLARIENQIRQQTQSYERRIEDLTLELLAAREENRELIRARIAQVKLEMETVRARMRAAAREP